MPSKQFALVSQSITALGDAPTVFVTAIRQRNANAMEVGCFVIDCGCLGVKDAWYELRELDLNALKERYFEEGCLEKSAEWARHFIESAASYAQSLGFKPHRDYKKACRVLGGIKTKNCNETFTFGRNGKPFYASGPQTDAETIRKVLNQLRTKCGDDGFHYFAEFQEIDDPIITQIEQCLEWAEAGRIEDAFRDLKPLLKKHPKNPKVLYAWGLAHIENDELPIGIRYLQMALEQDPSDDYAWYNLSAAYRQNNQIGRAFEANRKALALGHSNEDYWERAEEIDGVLLKCADENNITPEAYIRSHIDFDLGVEAMAAHQYESALKHFEDSVQINPQSYQAHGNIGTCLLQLGRMEKAREALQTSLAIEPNYAVAQRNMQALQRAENGEQLPSEVLIRNFTRDG